MSLKTEPTRLEDRGAISLPPLRITVVETTMLEAKFAVAR